MGTAGPRHGPLLFPIPRSVQGLDLTRRHAHELRPTLDSQLPAQGFRLVVDEAGAELRYADDAGLRYGLATVDQLRTEPDGKLPTTTLPTPTLPSVVVADHPDMQVRGYMLDISRNRVPTRATLERLVDVLETCRFNHLQLYVEHTFAYAEHAEVWADASPLSAEDMSWLDDLCHAAGIELVANQNCFGHMAPWLTLERYRGRAECPDGFEILDGVLLPPAVLAPTEANASMVVDLVREQAAALRSPTVNVGCDETFELGFGVSRERVEREGRTQVYAEHLHRIVDPLVSDGFTVQFWADMVAQHPEHLDLVPSQGTVALVWNYDGPSAPHIELSELARTIVDRLRIDVDADTGFDARLAPFVEHGVRHWVAPGTSSWSSFVGRLDNARDNLLDAAVAAVASGAEGYLVTDWGDNGHHQPLTVSFPAIAYGGAVAWGADANAALDVSPVLDAMVFGRADLGLGDVLDSVGRVATRTGVAARNSSPLFDAVGAPAFTFSSGAPEAASVQQVLADLDHALTTLEGIEPTGSATGEVLEELFVAVELARFGAEMLAAQADTNRTARVASAEKLDMLIGRYRTAWLTSSRPGGLDASVAHLERTRDRLRNP